MVVAEVLTGIALVQQSVAFIKSNIGTVQDIGQIAGQIDDLFRGEKEAQQARNKKAGNGLGSQFGVDTVAKEVMDAKLAAEKLQEVASMVDRRFGHGTWKSIVDERAKRIQEAKEAAAAVRRKKLEEARAFEEAVKQVALVATVVIISIVLFVFLFGMVL